jgi:hypothetical protein
MAKKAKKKAGGTAKPGKRISQKGGHAKGSPKNSSPGSGHSLAKVAPAQIEPTTAPGFSRLIAIGIYGAVIAISMIPFATFRTLRHDAQIVWLVALLVIVFLAVAAGFDFLAEKFLNREETDEDRPTA